MMQVCFTKMCGAKEENRTRGPALPKRDLFSVAAEIEAECKKKKQAIKHIAVWVSISNPGSNINVCVCMLLVGGWRGYQSSTGRLLDHLPEGSGHVRRWQHSAAVQQPQAGCGADSTGQKGWGLVRSLLQRMVSSRTQDIWHNTKSQQTDIEKSLRNDTKNQNESLLTAIPNAHRHTPAHNPDTPSRNCLIWSDFESVLSVIVSVSFRCNSSFLWEEESAK